jgi:hypothetical protein
MINGEVREPGADDITIMNAETVPLAELQQAAQEQGDRVLAQTEQAPPPPGFQASERPPADAMRERASRIAAMRDNVKAAQAAVESGGDAGSLQDRRGPAEDPRLQRRGYAQMHPLEEQRLDEAAAKIHGPAEVNIREPYAGPAHAAPGGQSEGGVINRAREWFRKRGVRGRHAKD